VEVTAESMYEAAALGVSALKSDGWADAIAPGTVVTIYFDDDVENTETFLLGSREIAQTTDLTVYSPESALGQAILGARSGQTVTYQAPNGTDIKVTVVSFEPFGR